MRTLYGVSPWIHGVAAARRPAYPRLRGEHEADVVIVGGGLTGCATAYACATAGLRVLVLERDRIGQGGAGRGEGLLLPEPGPAFQDVAAEHGVRLARDAFETWRRGALEAAALLRRLRAPGGVVPRKLVRTAGEDAEAWLAREHKARDRAGVSAALLGARPGSAAVHRPVAAALRLGDGFAIDPYRACLGLAAAAVRRGAAIHEHAHARRIRHTRAGAEVVLEAARVRASHVVVATGSPTAEIRGLRRHFRRRERYVVVTEPVGAPVRRELFPPDVVIADRHDPPRRAWRTADHRLVVSGAAQEETPARRRDGVLVQRTGQLMYELLTMYPAISGLAPAFGWDLTYGETRDGLMYLGAHRNYPNHLFAFGGPGHSATGAFVAARLLLRAIQGRPDRADAAFAFTR